MSKVDRFDRVISSLMTFAAVGTLALAGWRQFNAPLPSPSSQRSIRRIDRWEQKSRGAVRQLAYAPGSKVALTVFTDFECPFCRRLDSLLVDYRGKNPGEISLQIIHLPLSMHLNALPAAQAFECA
jgi:protein-disulfide isomerase